MTKCTKHQWLKIPAIRSINQRGFDVCEDCGEKREIDNFENEARRCFTCMPELACSVHSLPTQQEQ
jgi:hypothetical protein